jgi:DNA-binding transcriptional MerR regulator
MSEPAQVPESGLAADTATGRKSATAFRTISEVAGELEVPQHVLRFWESKFSQVRPLKRGGGRRYYRPEDIELLRSIRSLLYQEGYTIKGVQKLLREGGISRARPVLRAVGDGSASDAGDRGLAPDQRQEIENVIAELNEIKKLLKG